MDLILCVVLIDGTATIMPLHIQRMHGWRWASAVTRMCGWTVINVQNISLYTC